MTTNEDCQAVKVSLKEIHKIGTSLFFKAYAVGIYAAATENIKFMFGFIRPPIIPSSYIFYKMDPQGETVVVANENFDGKLFKYGSS